MLAHINPWPKAFCSFRSTATSYRRRAPNYLGQYISEAEKERERERSLKDLKQERDRLACNTYGW